MHHATGTGTCIAPVKPVQLVPQTLEKRFRLVNAIAGLAIRGFGAETDSVVVLAYSICAAGRANITSLSGTLIDSA